MGAKDSPVPFHIQASAGGVTRDLRRRVERILSGERRVEDLNRLFLDLRTKEKCPGSVREIGDFLAHRDGRDRGAIFKAAQDLHTSAHSWLTNFGIDGKPVAYNLERLSAAARANLRRATPEQIYKKCRCTPSEARAALDRAIKKLGGDDYPNRREERVFNYLAGSFIWNPAFDDERLFSEFCAALISNGLLNSEEKRDFQKVKTFIVLFAISQMHLATVSFDHGAVTLFAGYRNSREALWVRAQLAFYDFGKPHYMPLCVFNTSLHGPTHCDPKLQISDDDWIRPLEVVSGSFLDFV